MLLCGFVETLFCLAGVPAAGSRAPHSVGTDQQTVPPPVPGEPHHCFLSASTDGPGGEPAVGPPAEEGGSRAPQTQGETGGQKRSSHILQKVQIKKGFNLR